MPRSLISPRSQPLPALSPQTHASASGPTTTPAFSPSCSSHTTKTALLEPRITRFLRRLLLQHPRLSHHLHLLHPIHREHHKVAIRYRPARDERVPEMLTRSPEIVRTEDMTRQTLHECFHGEEALLLETGTLFKKIMYGF